MNIKLFATSLDGTLIGKPDASIIFTATWQKLNHKKRPILCYNTGRLLSGVLDLVQKNKYIPEADYLICGIGTEIYDYHKKKKIDEYSKVLKENWDIKLIEEIIKDYPQIIKQPEEFQTDFKSSWFYEDVSQKIIDEIKEKLITGNLSVNIVYSSPRFLDFVPGSANKGNALKWLINYLNINPEEVLVAGDSGNDTAMFLVKGVKGIVVENSRLELFQAVTGKSVYYANTVFANGVLEGLKYYNVIDEISDIGLEEFDKKNYFEPEISRLFTPDYKVSLSKNDKLFLIKAYEMAVKALKKNITPLGFSACSLEDNEVIGTDVNYRSIWGRDGSLAIIGSLSLEDEQIRTCQVNTLKTLLKHVSKIGQTPSHVLIEKDKPDYSGVGGICSIDSGLWLIIAFYEYIRTTEDMEFLNKYFSILEKIMSWLKSHDSNNDELLEIPEAGDWTDLFGRSYNILYDEVLWFKANICFGHLLEYRKKSKESKFYFKSSQDIKKAILQKFWPTTKNNNFKKTFTDIQYSMGETKYLLAQVTPFAFNWRCDVYANILAYLFNLLDIDRAKTAFRFMWEVGVNSPYPVINLYPTVHSGDPDWRSYYTVNLLNLAHHYHNGGIWPFIGGFWVQFIYQLGLIDVACQELLKLAELNKQGKTYEWEYNEWAHGKTGKPMGKAFQAWSASSFILAYNNLKSYIEQII